ncbi:MAG TPA: hypothetical protein VKA23_05390 [Mariprofundaceae bacterium]|nr:hypothetical protein [Mariprofundaceae bacterium]
MRLLLSITLLLLFAIPASAAEETYYIGPEKGVDLRLRPENRAAVSGHFDHKTEVKILKRDRNWAKVQTLDYTAIRGWVPAGAVRKSSTQSTRSSSPSFLSSFTSLFRSSDPEQKTAVLGVRGLDSGDGSVTDKKAGKKALKIVEWMDTLNVPDGEVTAFVKEGDLKP